MSVLEEICARKRKHVRLCEAQRPLVVLEKEVEEVPITRGFKNKISNKSPALIAEIKKASPSGGVIRPGFDPAALAQAYERGGAACLSVLTDTPYFQGRNEDLAAARGACALPVLRKDFMLTPWQIYESRAIGADCVLLIVAALEDAQARELMGLARALGMDVLVEVHDRAELERALALGADMIGVNNRNLKTLKVDLRTGVELAPLIPGSVVRIAESGIHGHEDLLMFSQAGYNGFLVGESLMRQEDVAQAARNLLGAGLDSKRELN